MVLGSLHTGTRNWTRPDSNKYPLTAGATKKYRWAGNIRAFDFLYQIALTSPVRHLPFMFICKQLNVKIKLLRKYWTRNRQRYLTFLSISAYFYDERSSVETGNLRWPDQNKNPTISATLETISRVTCFFSTTITDRIEHILHGFQTWNVKITNLLKERISFSEVHRSVNYTVSCAK